MNKYNQCKRAHKQREHIAYVNTPKALLDCIIDWLKQGSMKKRWYSKSKALSFHIIFIA